MNRIESRYNVRIHVHSLLLFLHESNEQVIAGDLSTTTFKVNSITLCMYQYTSVHMVLLVRNGHTQ